MINPKNQRFYWLMLQQDLFGIWCICKIYGGLRNNHRRELWIPYETEHEASYALSEIEYFKRQRGYVYAEMPDTNFFALKPQTLAEVLAS
jgi:hypothetical protein